MLLYEQTQINSGSGIALLVGSVKKKMLMSSEKTKKHAVWLNVLYTKTSIKYNFDHMILKSYFPPPYSLKLNSFSQDAKPNKKLAVKFKINRLTTVRDI